jgi:hypothetical protein
VDCLDADADKITNECPKYVSVDLVVCIYLFSV